MSAIRARDTRPEMILRRGLHAAGFRYGLHNAKLPGRPDMVLPKYDAVILVNGCFWHAHDCHMFKWPKTRTAFWEDKILGNRNRDRRNALALRGEGWRILRVWECALKGRTRLGADAVIEQSVRWLRGSTEELDIQGHE